MIFPDPQIILAWPEVFVMCCWNSEEEEEIQKVSLLLQPRFAKINIQRRIKLKNSISKTIPLSLRGDLDLERDRDRRSRSPRSSAF